MTRRRSILDNIAGRISAFTGVTVTPWRQFAFAPAELPAIAWRDKVELIDKSIYGFDRYRLTVVYAGCTVGAVSSARQLLAQVAEVIGSDTRHSNLAQSTNLIDSAIGLNVGGEIVAGFTVKLEIVYIPGEESTAETFRLQDEQGNNLTDENGDTLTW